MVSTRIPTKDGLLAVRFDGDPQSAPMLLCQRFRGTMDDWDPEFVARLATARRVIRFDSLGIGESSGETPNSVRGMAEVVPLLLDALEIDAVDLLGWSIGGYVGQTVALTWPERVRHLVIAGSGPGGPDGPPPHLRVAEIAAKTAATREDVRFCSSREPKPGPQPRDGISIAFVSGSARPLRRNPVADSARRSCHGGRAMERHDRILASYACRSWWQTALPTSWSLPSTASQLRRKRQGRSSFSTPMQVMPFYFSTRLTSVPKC